MSNKLEDLGNRMQDNNDLLPVTVAEQIKTNAALRAYHNEGKDDSSFANGYYNGYIAGATEWATKLHALGQEFNNIRKANQRWEESFNMATRGYDAAYNDLQNMKSERDELKERAEKMEAALNIIHAKAQGGIFPHLPVETIGAAMCIEIEKIAHEWKIKEVKNDG